MNQLQFTITRQETALIFQALGNLPYAKVYELIDRLNGEISGQSAESDAEVTFSVSLEEANLILRELGNFPFRVVYELIGKINIQANTQAIGRKNLN